LDRGCALPAEEIDERCATERRFHQWESRDVHRPVRRNLIE
jgi:hypothetical protein